MNPYASAALSSLEEAAIFNLGGAVVALIVFFIFQVPLSASFGFIILIESTGLMLVGGALGVAGQATTRKITEMVLGKKPQTMDVAKSDVKAALYAMTGALLFAEGAILAVIFA